MYSSCHIFVIHLVYIYIYTTVHSFCTFNVHAKLIFKKVSIRRILAYTLQYTHGRTHGGGGSWGLNLPL